MSNRPHRSQPTHVTGDPSHRTCIYCDEPNSFTDEHVFPAGMGGDDRKHLLKDLVCGHCNTDVFSKMEARFMRSSPAAIGRVFLQPTGRGKGKKASIPSIETRTTTIFDEQYGAIEAEVTAHGKAIPLLQLLFLQNGTIAFTGGDHALPECFLKSVELALGETVSLVKKHKDEKLRHYRVETFEWAEGRYVSKSDATVDRPPTTCIWCESLAPTSEKNAQLNRAPTLYQRLAGQINLRVPQDISVASLLSNARVAVSEFRGRLGPYKVIENPLVHVSMSMDIEDYGRVLAKIGMNLLMHVYGEDYARHHAFKRIKQLILHGGENIPWVSPPTAG